eukprot:2049642-Pleurochrysis_carterae.AAC.3
MVSDSMLRTVMTRLKNMARKGGEQQHMEAIQVIAGVLNQEGHYAKLILGRAASVRKQAVSFAESRHNGIMKRKCQGPFPGVLSRVDGPLSLPREVHTTLAPFF